MFFLRPRLYTPHNRCLYSQQIPNCGSTSNTLNCSDSKKLKPAWFTLPPYRSHTDASNVTKTDGSSYHTKVSEEMTAIKWVVCCLPGIPMSLLYKLFRLKKIRKHVCSNSDKNPPQSLKVAVKDVMNIGERILLPATVQMFTNVEKKSNLNKREINFVQSLELYKDAAIIAINKPPGISVQGGSDIQRSLDKLIVALQYEYSEPPRLIHRLDKDTSGVLVIGRTRATTTILHSIFRRKTLAAPTHIINLGDDDAKPILEKRYWALVIGSPKEPEGLISAPLCKVVLDDGKSDRIKAIENSPCAASQHAVTHYRTLWSSHGFTWLELAPITGRKHQLRVHCADVLGTPIVGDYRYGLHTHRKWKSIPCPFLRTSSSQENLPPFQLDFESGSVCEKRPRLHLHCKKLVLPNVSRLSGHEVTPNFDFSCLERIKLGAPLPPYMKTSWDILSF